MLRVVGPLAIVPEIVIAGASTPRYPATPAAVSGDPAAATLAQRASAQAPPSAAAPTLRVAAATWARADRSKPATKSAPSAPAPVSQLHSLNSPPSRSARP